MKYLSLTILLIFLACGTGKEEVDLLVVNAKVYTVDPSFSTASAFAVRNGKFLAIGESAQLKSLYSAEQVLDAGGKAIVPGLIDGHCHFYDLGLKEQQLNLVGTGSFEEVLGMVRRYKDKYRPNIIIGKGWDQNDWEIKELPDKTALDTLFPDIPVVLERIDGHAYLVNQKVLDLAGITNSTRVEGGEIVKHKGRLTGIIIDSPMELIDEILPKTSVKTRIEALKAAERICLNHGLTTVNDAGLNPDIISLIDSLQQAGELSVRIYAMVSNHPANLDYYLKKGPLKTDRLHVRSFKVYADGALGSRGAALKRPYSDLAGHYGAMVTPVDSIGALAKRIAASEFQMNTHAIGDSANAVVLRAYTRVLGSQSDRRWKIEHAQVVTPADAKLFENGIVPSIQPTHATSDMYWAEDRLGSGRIEHAYNYKSLLGQAGRVVLGTDFPVEEVSPFLTFYAAIARQDLQGYPDGGFRPEEALSREEALRGMTIWAAWSNFEDTEKGSIETGKWADFVLLSNDIMQVPALEIPGIEAVQVYIGGRRVK